ncbi:MAG: site-2 protease family protein [Firmicutes bacterium]|jgi:Zn-dependent protease|nr:site-2 protease family protein [Bacillota bacterium]NLL87486.1 site-2 protease family protein [Bacillota bacterium]HKM17485.1 site-2 protease family protein [Limnochordia bacterium]
MSLEELVYSIVAALFAISIHELAHGAVADRLGDPTPRALGRLTLNPLKHLDPIGVIMLVLFKVGWAKPVQINPLYFKDRRRDVILVALAGPFANLTVACIISFLGNFLYYLPFHVQFLNALAYVMAINININIILAAFNLIPLPPLDGSRIIANLLPLKIRIAYERIAPYAPLILILGIWTGLLRYAINPIVSFLGWIVNGFSI